MHAARALRTPIVVNCPAAPGTPWRIPPRGLHPAMVGTIDLMPTILDRAREGQVSIPSWVPDPDDLARFPDAKSLRPLVTGATDDFRTLMFSNRDAGGDLAVREARGRSRLACRIFRARCTKLLSFRPSAVAIARPGIFLRAARPNPADSACVRGYASRQSVGLATPQPKHRRDTVYKFFLTAVAGIMTIGLGASAAHAQFNFPKKANKFQATMVTAYAPCTAPNDTTTGVLALPACHPAVRSDTVCGFDVSDPAKPLGQGQLQAVVTGSGAKLDIKLQVKLQGLEAGCIGQTLCIAPFLRASSTGCASADPGGCTTLESLTNPFALSGAGCGVVDDKGKLQIKTTVDTATGIDLIAPGTHLSLDLARTGVRRTTGPSLPAAGALSFASGVLAP